MSMMINPSGGGQIIAAGQPFKLKVKKKRPAAEQADQAETAEAAAPSEQDEQGEDTDS